MISLKELLDSSFRLIGIRNISANQYQDALIAMNVMVESFSVDRSLYKTVSKTEMELQSGVLEYTLPESILTLEHLTVLKDGFEHEITGLDYKAYNAIEIKDDVPCDLPIFYYENSGKLYIYPKPSITLPMYLYARSILTLSSNLEDDLDVPNNWIRPLRYNLAVMIAPEYGIEVLDSVRKIAASSKAVLNTVYVSSEATVSGFGGGSSDGFASYPDTTVYITTTVPE